MKTGPSRCSRPSYCYAGHRKKIRYRTLKDAKIGRRSRAESAEYLRIYRCPKCHGYHLTSQRLIKQNSTVWRDKETED